MDSELRKIAKAQGATPVVQQRVVSLRRRLLISAAVCFVATTLMILISYLCGVPAEYVGACWLWPTVIGSFWASMYFTKQANAPADLPRTGDVKQPKALPIKAQCE